MEFFDSPAFMYSCAVLSVISTNVLPYWIFIEKSKYRKICAALFCSAMFVLCYLGVLWSITNEFFIAAVIVFALSYIHFCFALKRRINLKLYTIIFIILSLFFAIWTTVMFGRYYVINGLIDFSNHISQYNSIIDTNDWFPIMDFKLSILFFDVSFENYFTLPDDVSLRNPFFIQFVFGIIVSGTIISWAIDVIKHFVTPANPN